MHRPVRSAALVAGALMTIGSVTVHARQPTALDQALDAMRNRTSFGSGDQRQISDWINQEWNRFADLAGMRKRFGDQYHNPANSAAFRKEFAGRVADAAVARFARPRLSRGLSQAIARILVDLDRGETVPALLAGLVSPLPVTRFLCATGLARQRSAIAADPALLSKTIVALGQAGAAESDPVVLGRIYEALALPGNVPAVLDAYLTIFDKRLASRRGPLIIADGAELAAYEFFRISAVAGALDDGQKAKLVARLAVFLRIDAERYQTGNLAFPERDHIERALVGVEAVFTALGITGGGDIRGALAAGGTGMRAAVVAEVYKWIGDPKSKKTGPLNAAPWNLSAGAP
ncbi:MAG: hypothetical protein ACE5EX_11370 [Phycisphaerae bacterium]